MPEIVDGSEVQTTHEQNKTPQQQPRRSTRLRTPTQRLSIVDMPATPSRGTTAKRSRRRSSKGNGKAKSSGGGEGKGNNKKSTAKSTASQSKDEQKAVVEDTELVSPRPEVESEGERGDIEDDVDEYPDAAQLSSEGEDYKPDEFELSENKTSNRKTKLSIARDSSISSKKRQSAYIFESEDTPSKKLRQPILNRIPVNVTKHDPFRIENLKAISDLLTMIPTIGSEHDERHDMLKMSEAFKMCAIENLANVPDPSALSEVYMLLAWSLHSARPRNPEAGDTVPEPPAISDAARNILIKIFTLIGDRIREETTEMASSCRRHAARKLYIKSNMVKGTLSEDMAGSPEAMEIDERRNPLGISTYLTDVYRQFATNSTRALRGKSKSDDN
ncbi:hypothetical protein EV182_003136 [Spiromyces aspiralis]|uniref:Uncharacterized protein n=1 Tax=Spiromyces aspiralis TaxID=68401 RepID=A0ACC1HD39_9FUNG|nr:hypothetical protein EV182_003136 [Spiromyces aspiralis]